MKKKVKIHNASSTILKKVDTFKIVTFWASKTLPKSCFGRILLPISTGIECCLTKTKKFLLKLFTKKEIKTKNYYQRAQQTYISFENLSRKCLQKDEKDKKKVYDVLSNIFT